MTLVLQKGRPADTTGRLDKEIRTYDLLDSLGVEYARVDHAPAMTMEDCKEVEEILEKMVYIQFAAVEDFLNTMVAAQALPHTDLERYPTVKEKLERLREEERAADGQKQK